MCTQSKYPTFVSNLVQVGNKIWIAKNIRQKSAFDKMYKKKFHACLYFIKTIQVAKNRSFSEQQFVTCCHKKMFFFHSDFFEILNL